MNKVLVTQKFCAFLTHNEWISWIHYETVRSALQITKKHILGASVSHYAVLSIVRPQ